MKVLLVEDDGEAAAFIESGLVERGHAVDIAPTGTEGLELGSDRSYSVIIVDRMLPGVDGLSLVKRLRGSGVRTPVLFLSTLGCTDDRIRGLESGGDDYLAKPFAFAELAARLDALARRPPLVDAHPVLQVHDLELDRLARTVRRQGRQVNVQPREFALLEYLMKNAGHVVTKTML
ncbi:MAG: response regulator transcription factor, partial [Proteobacteria bacterium]|nr:response regulator transcription factor [Pseudomonadota bacterium]